MQKPIDILRKGADHWNQWRKRNPDVTIDFSGLDLSGIKLLNANLNNINFDGADLSKADLSGSNLRLCTFEAAFLSEINLKNAHIYRADFFDAVLSGATMTGAELGEANFLEADLSGSDLSKAMLVGASFAGGNLSKTTIIGVDLTEAHFVRTNLSEANFSDSILTNTTFSNCDLSYVDFNGCKMGYTVFALTNLSSCKNLDSVLVYRPCPIDFESLKNTPNISKGFLSKIGLPDNYIEYLPDFFAEEGILLYPVFLSHAAVNKDFCSPLYERLISKGVKVWYDEKKIKPGDFIREEIHKGVSLYDKMLLVCSKESLSSWWVEQEIDRYEAKERAYWKEHGEKISLIIPIAIDDEVFISTNAIAPNLKNRNIADFRKWKSEDDYNKAFENLILALNVNRKGENPISFL